MKIGFDIVAATPKRVRDDLDDAPTQSRMTAGHPIRRNPSTDQKKARGLQRRRTASDTPTEENSMPTTEADLLAKMAAATTLPEQRQYAAELESLRMERSASARVDAQVDLANTIVESRFPTLSVAQFTQHTASTDWLGEVEPDAHDTKQVEASMRAEATVWYNKRPDEVRADTEELRAQASGMADHLASQFGATRGSATYAFLSQVEHLATIESGRKVAFDEVQKPPYGVPSGSSLPVGVENKDTFDESIWHGSDHDQKSTENTGEAPSLSEGDAPEGDHSEGIENPEAGKTHAEDNKDTSHTDYLDGTKTKNTASVHVAEQHVPATRPTEGSRVRCACGWASSKDHDLPTGWKDFADHVGKTAAKGESKDYCDHCGRKLDAHDHRDLGVCDGCYNRVLDETNNRRKSSQQHVADDQKSNTNTGLTPSLSEGDSPEGDHAESPVKSPEGNADASGGDKGATDSIDGTAYPKQSTLLAAFAAKVQANLPQA